MRIGELSERTGVSSRSLRYWEQQGLLPSERLPNGYREYADDAPRTVEAVRSLLGIGLPTAVIRQILPCTGSAGPQAESCPGLLSRIAELRDNLDATLATLTANRDALSAYLDTARAAAPPAPATPAGVGAGIGARHSLGR